jgi:hypothetical protein
MRSVGALLPILLLVPMILQAYAAGRTSYSLGAQPLVRRESGDGRYVPLEKIIVRDPFAGAPNAPQPKPTETFQSADAVDLNDVVALDIRPEPSEPKRELVLKATIVGDVPVAYLAAGSALRIVRVGDLVDERKVIAIDARGIALSGGVRLNLETIATPRALAAPARPRATRSHNGNHGTTPRPATPVPSEAAATAPPSTPGPLPTIRPGAYPIGSQPTPDPFAPTAFPYPYPYPPR